MSASRSCPHCGAETGPGQEYCLSCGHRLSRASQRIHWLWPTLAALVVAAVGATIAVAANKSGGNPETIVALSPLRPAPAETAAGLVAWPRKDGYTIVLATVPVKTRAPLADRRAKRAVRASLPDVGILASSDFASLHPGYRVVFTGIYDSADEAQASLAHARSAFGNAYVQAITR